MRLRLSSLIFWLISASFISCSPPGDTPQAKEGLLDLKQWSWERGGKVDLSGEWSFYWQQFITPESFEIKQPVSTRFLSVPDTWPTIDSVRAGTGYATYRLKVQLPSNSIPLSLRVNTAATAMRIWLNGKEVYQVGKATNNAQDAQPGYYPQIISVPPVETLDIVVHVSNYHYRKGGLWDSLELGSSKIIIRKWIWDYVLMSFLVGSFFIMALYHLILYIHRRSNLSSLYFSGLCLLVIIRTLSTDLHVLGFIMPWDWMLRSELLSFYLCIPVFATFTRIIYPSMIPRWLVQVSVVGAAIASLAVVVLPTWWATHTVVPFEIFAIGVATYGTLCILKASWRSIDDITLFLLGFLGLFMAMVNDALYANNIINTFYAAPFGLFFFLFFQSALLSRRFSQTANALEAINIQLEQKNQEIEEKHDELITLNQEMDVFVYRTSHDLRAPLTSLLGIIGLMRNESLSPAIEKYLSLQERSIHKLDGFVREILDYSRNSRLDITPQAIDFHVLIDETYNLYSHLPQYEQIDKRTTIKSSATFLGDSKRLEVVFNNLISNALRYYNPYQDNPYIEIRIDVTEQQVFIEVQDNGLGIAAEHIDRIFDMFYRASNHQDSSGLGLFLVKETIAKMQGIIRVNSTVNQGTTFTINLPNYTAETEQDSPSSAI